MEELDSHDQLRMRVNYRSNADKALNELIGICTGIASNDEVNIDELVYLGAWLSKNSNLQKDSNYLELMEKTKGIVAAKKVEPYKIKDLLNLVQDVNEHRLDTTTPFENANVATRRLFGFCRGILADDIFDDKEIYALRTWIEKSDRFIDVWPISELHEHVKKVLEDGVITEQERFTLLKTVKNAVGGIHS